MPATSATARASVFAPTIPGLPSGYTGLPRELVEASQRQRLLHGVTVAVAAKGYGATTINDIAVRAGVSKKTFYEHFPDKLACFLGAYDHGRHALLEVTVGASLLAAQEGADPISQLRLGIRAYAEFLAREEQYARTFFLEILAAGPEAIARHRACREDFIRSLRTWHKLAREQHPDWPRASEIAYEAATGAVHEMSTGRIATGQAAELVALEDDLVEVQLAVLRVPRD